ncbi:MAG: 5-amino-6-(D-ribitylamino)uracil--L-tyrosine 4-hydroxyphenyl transferase CofH [Polyangiaceae bacterium]|nr:5-amino-6-(D-ribitylamino)uracil--L-tyrosine 4-hydroxyphenyl transferase CofH [Polyangiaceae bacterium]
MTAVDLSLASPRTADLLARALDGDTLDAEEGATLDATTGADLDAVIAAADALRARHVGDVATYVTNRNINFTNACVKACRFCAFSRVQRSDEAYFLDEDEIVRRVEEAVSLGATEVCVQAGLSPRVDGGTYERLTRAIKRAAPRVHLHAFSPEEIKFGAALAGEPVRDFLARLRDAGLGSLPGTSAEILDDAVRDRLAPGRVTTDEWLEIIRAAHALGVPTTSTIMFGHLESPLARARHLALLRRVQRETGGFTEIVPLSFVHEEAPLFARGLLGDGYRPPSTDEIVRFHAVVRLMLSRDIPHVQASWVKVGLSLATRLLSAGCDDLGGTLINESISTSAGAGHGQLATPRELREAARAAGRLPRERDTLYRPVRDFGPTERDEDASPLDAVGADAARFGSFHALIHEEAHRHGRVALPQAARRNA